MSHPDAITMSQNKNFQTAAALAQQAEVFCEVASTETALICKPIGCEGDAEYRIELLDGRVFVLWASPDRYLSQSIEADLMWTGDDLDDCIDEELVDQGWTGGSLGGVEHFRDEQMRYVFRSSIPSETGAPDLDKEARRFVQCLLAFEATFRELGDMSGDDD